MSDAYFDDLLDRFTARDGTGLTGLCPANDPALERMVGARGYVGHVGHAQPQRKKAVAPCSFHVTFGSVSPGTEADIALLLNNLRFDFTGVPLHDIDEDLADMIRRAMLPMEKRKRAELAVRIDDHLTASSDLATLRVQLETHIESPSDAPG